MLEIRCSNLARAMACAGSLFFKDLPAQETDQAAEEGTAAGEFLQKLLTMPGVRVTESHAKNGVMFDDDMKFHATEVSSEIFANAHTEVLCETRIDWPTRSGIWIRGQYDAAYVGRDGRLYIDDLKYGWGLVEVKENWQLLGYAIGEVMRRGVAFDVVLRIHQPRPHHEDGPVRRWELSYAELLAYKERIEEHMMTIVQGNRTLTTNAKCRYCPAAAEACPAANKAFYRGIEMAHDFLQDQISEKELAHQLDLVARITEVLKIKGDSLKSLAVDRIKKGVLIPGYVTESSYSDRKWKPGIGPEVIEAMTGKKIVEQVMLSPAKAEKAGVPKDFVNALVDRHFLGQKLVKRDTSALGDKIFGKQQVSQGEK